MAPFRQGTRFRKLSNSGYALIKSEDAKAHRLFEARLMSEHTVRILYIGNSFTARNDLPGIVNQMGEGQSITIEHELISAGGASLRRHFNAGATDKIRGAVWDFVVLQEQSTLPVKNRKRFHGNVREYVSAAADTGAKLALYMTWAKKEEPDNQTLLTEAYNEIGKELGVIVVPAGVAWELMLAKHTEPVLHDNDGSHPTLSGSYLSACTFIPTLFGVSPIRIALDGLAEEDQELLIGFAETACA